MLTGSYSYVSEPAEIRDGVERMEMAEAELRIQPLLGEGESLLWLGLPKRGMVFHRFDWFSMVLSLVPALGGALAVMSSPGNILSYVVGLVGAYMLVGRLALDAWFRRTETYYALTTHRAIAVTANHMRCAELGSIGRIRLTLSIAAGGGCGVVWFGEVPEFAQSTEPEFLGFYGKASKTTRLFDSPFLEMRALCSTPKFVLPLMEAEKVIQLALSAQNSIYGLHASR